MQSEPVYYLTSFDTTTATMEAQQLLKENGIRIALMPTPRAIQSSCGLSVRFGTDDLAAVQRLLEGALSEGSFHFYSAYKNGTHSDFVPLEDAM